MPIEQDPNAALRARHTALLAASGLATYFACLWMASPWLRFSLPLLAAVMLPIIVLNVALAATARRWGAWRYAGAAYGAGHAVLMTVVLHVVGGMGASFLLFVHLFPIFHAAMLGPTAAVFLTANVSGLCFAMLVVAEVSGILPVRGGLPWSSTLSEGVAEAGIAWAGFNFFAIYASSYGEELRRSARLLADEVAIRTAALRSANDELARRARALEAAQEELRTLLYAVTHDIKSPVNSILLIADLLCEQPDVQREPAIRAELERIIRLAGGTEDMIRDLFDFFQLMAAREVPDWFDLGPMVAEAVETIRPQLEARGVVVDVEALPRLWGERRKIGRVVTNLLTNAMQHAPARGGRVRVAGRREPDAVVFTVTDNGPGIPPRYHAAIFELFARVPREDGEAPASGSGVGLAVVRRIVDAHHGIVTVDSDVGCGAAFVVRLPVPMPAMEETAA